MDHQVQLRWYNGRIEYVDSIRNAFATADIDHDIEKISWTERGKNVRFVRAPGQRAWTFEPMEEIVKQAVASTGARPFPDFGDDPEFSGPDVDYDPYPTR